MIDSCVKQIGLPLDPIETQLSPAACNFVRQVARVRAPVLLLGETGVGKTILARHIHRCGPSRAEPFVRVDCAAIPAEIFERELFGHRRGAFTGATDSKAGLVEEARSGTLFIDEVGELPLPLQPKLLTLLSEGTFRSLGDTTYRPSHARIITATNRNLARLVAEGSFRPDLYYRCAVLRFEISPLRARSADLRNLMRYMLGKIAAENELRSPPTVERCAEDALLRYHWPGNLRELWNALTYAVTFSDGQSIRAINLPDSISSEISHLDGHFDRHAKEEYDIAQEERTVILDALRATSGRRDAAAVHLGMSRQTLWRKMTVMSIGKDEWRRPSP